MSSVGICMVRSLAAYGYAQKKAKPLRSLPQTFGQSSNVPTGFNELRLGERALDGFQGALKSLVCIRDFANEVQADLTGYIEAD